MNDNTLLFGGVPERSKGSDCKSDGSAFEGSNPSPSTRIFSQTITRKASCLEKYNSHVMMQGCYPIWSTR